MSFQSGLLTEQEELKQSCQSIINAIIQKGSIHRKQCNQMNDQSQIISPPQIMINLDQQSDDFHLFFSDPLNRSHWIGEMFHNMNKERQSISLHQFISNLLIDQEEFREEIQKSQQQSNCPNIKLREYQFYYGTPKYALLLITFQSIIRDMVIFTVRNFRGQIIFLSFSTSERRKYDILEKFSNQFETPFLLIYDNIDDHFHPKSQITKQEFEKLSRNMELAYFKRKQTQENFQAQETDPSFFISKFDTIFSQELYKQVVKPLVKMRKNDLLQNLILYNLCFDLEEMSLFGNVDWEEFAIIRIILQLNFEKRSNKELIKGKEFINFRAFIQKEILIYEQMETQIIALRDKHYPSSIPTYEKCLLCLENTSLSKQTRYKCFACSELKKTNVPLCPECFSPYHDLNNILFATSKTKHQNSGPEEAHSNDRNMSDLPNIINQSQLTDKNQNQMSQPQKKTLKKNKKIEKQKVFEFSQGNKEKLMRLQESAQKILGLFGQFKNSQKFYKPKHKNASSEKEYEVELKNQAEYMKAIDQTIARQLSLFQNQMFLKIHEKVQFKPSSKPQKSEQKSEKEEQKKQKRSQKIEFMQKEHSDQNQMQSDEK